MQISHSLKPPAALLLALLLICLAAMPAQEDSGQPQLESYLRQIDTAQQLRNDKLVLKLLRKAQQQFPQQAILWQRSGQFYEQQNLLRLSLESYRRAQQLEPQNTRFIRRIAVVQDRLGQYTDAVASYRRLEQLGSSAERNEARRKRGWLLYKLHRYAEAEASILAIPPEDRSSAIMMTLAIVYSAAYNYEKSRQAYEQSLVLTYPQTGSIPNYAADYAADTQSPTQDRQRNQRALIYYNYALLETDFMHFDQAMQLTQKSIDNLSFASNELLAGELYLQQRKFLRAKEAFLKSQQLEELSSQPSPLALLDLVQLSIDQGSYRSGMVFFQELEQRFRKQTQWMTSYGIDPVNFDLELMKLRISLYQGLWQEEKWLLPLAFQERWQRAWRLVKYRWLYWFASARHSLLAYRVGKEHHLQGNSLDASQQLFAASSPSRSSGWGLHSGLRLRRRFFRQLQAEQLLLVPRAEGQLLLEEAILEQNPAKMQHSLSLLDPLWEGAEIERAHIALSRLAPKGASKEGQAERYRQLLLAYQSNRAALKNEGIRLPLRLQISGSAARKQIGLAGKLRKYLSCAGVEIVTDPSLPVLVLQLQWSQEGVKSYLLSQKGTVLRTIDSTELEALLQGKQGTEASLKRFVRSFMQQALAP